jgi:hypothetical protein
MSVTRLTAHIAESWAGVRFIAPVPGQLEEYERHDEQYIAVPGAKPNLGWFTEIGGDPPKHEERNHGYGYLLIDPKIKQVRWESENKTHPHEKFIRSAQIKSKRGFSSPGRINQKNEPADHYQGVSPTSHRLRRQCHTFAHIEVAVHFAAAALQLFSRVQYSRKAPGNST